MNGLKLWAQSNGHIQIETDANIPVCTVSEAVMLMDLSNECAQMFRNSANNHISMVYRRKDGNIGWVEPKADN